MVGCSCLKDVNDAFLHIFITVLPRLLLLKDSAHICTDMKAPFLSVPLHRTVELVLIGGTFHILLLFLSLTSISTYTLSLLFPLSLYYNVHQFSLLFFFFHVSFFSVDFSILLPISVPSFLHVMSVILPLYQSIILTISFLHLSIPLQLFFLSISVSHHFILFFPSFLSSLFYPSIPLLSHLPF